MGRRVRVVVLTVLVFGGVAGLFLLTVSTTMRMAGGGGLGLGPRVGIVELDGVILDVEEILKDLRRYRDNPQVRAVVVRINSPGGVVGPTQELHQGLRRVHEAGKPVVASLGAVAASGGYYVAVAADEIFASPGTLTGSIGVVMQLANLEGLMKKVGVEYVVIKAGQFKDVGNVGRPMTTEERRLLQQMLDDVHGQFIDAVAAGRKLERQAVLRFADGRIVSGAQAKALSMVDRLGGLEDAVDRAAELAGLPTPPEVIPPRRHVSIMDLLKNQIGLDTLSWPVPALPVFRTPLYLMD